MKIKVVLIGAGNVATHLALALQPKCEVVQIYSKTLAHAERLAATVRCEAVDDLNRLRDDADVYIISVKDDAIARVIGAVQDNGALWLHTSGSKPMDLFSGRRKRYGVLYPMQSFSRTCAVDFTEVPVFVEGSDEDAGNEIRNFAKMLSAKVYEADSSVRKRLHIAAVFSCNFANHLWALASDVLADANLPFETMLPLIRSTVDKLKTMAPEESQTGPAVREDYEVMHSHEEMLDAHKRNIYELLSNSIITKKKIGNEFD